MKVLFFGSSDYCLPILEILDTNCALVGIVTKPSSPSHSFAVSHKTPVFTPENRKELYLLQAELTKLQPDVAIVADYGIIIPPEIFHIPKKKTLNIHFSKLPKLRGASPVQFTILTGQKSAWITIIVMDETMDTGDIIWQEEMKKIEGTETTRSLYEELFQLISVKLPSILTDYSQGKLPPQKQNHSEATYTKILSRNNGFIPGHILDTTVKGGRITEEQLKHWLLFSQLTTYNLQPTTFIEHAVRAFTPWPGVWTEVMIEGKKKRLKILKVHVQPIPPQRDPRCCNAQEFANSIGTTKLHLDLVQLEGKNPVSWKQFIEGHSHFSFT